MSTTKTTKSTSVEILPTEEGFLRRHIGPNPSEVKTMLEALGVSSLTELYNKVIPESIHSETEMNISVPMTEEEVLDSLAEIAKENQVWKSFLGQGYYGTFLPTVIRRNILENPGWYTAYTPYQAEISQGRLEALLNYQTMILDLTSMEISNASLLDEGTACAEAMYMLYSLKPDEQGTKFFVSEDTHPQSIDVILTRAEPLGIEVVVGFAREFQPTKEFFGALIQYPGSKGSVWDITPFLESCKKSQLRTVVASDLLSLCILKSPGEMGADVVVGSTQRFGLSFGFGGPHSAFFATKDEFKRNLPGRLVGVSKDSQGNHGLRLTLQTREQHIKRDKATSNICTAQVLLAVLSSMYALYHGPAGLKNIANRVHRLAVGFLEGLNQLGFQTESKHFFDTVTVLAKESEILKLKAHLESQKINVRYNTNDKSEYISVSFSFDELTKEKDVLQLLEIFAKVNGKAVPSLSRTTKIAIPEILERTSSYLNHPVFNSYHTETKMLRYIRKLESRDLSLTSSMIPLGSCTMKLNSTTEMLPVTWSEFANIHPFAPKEQWKGYTKLISRLEEWLCQVTGFAAVSLQPNAGSQGEFAGLLAIRNYHLSRNDKQRTTCLIPVSAHGTNPASAVLAGMEVVVVACDSNGNIDVADLKKKAEEHKDTLAALMVTYPSTHGVFEDSIREICDTIHAFGGQVYMDGANMNAQVGLTSPALIGADVCHLNLHKTFCIPHGGGGPGIGPIGVAKHLVPFLPGHRSFDGKTASKKGAVSSAPFGSANILVIPYAYIQMLGSEGLKYATIIAILNANYIAKRLEGAYPILYKGKEGLVAHECILDLRPLKKTSGIEAEDVAKRLMDYGFHAPTLSFPVAGTLMVEPTESESIDELDRFCDAMLSIFEETKKIESGEYDSKDNPLKNAPHTMGMVAAETWNHKYSREVAAFPLEFVKERKFWPHVGRIDNVYGDRNIVCSCLPLEEYTKST